jgi:broad specificity phosphatase PhoE
MKTVLYLLRHGATEANLADPTRLQGQRHNPPLARLGVRQAEATRDFLAIRPIDRCYCSPLLRAVQTAAIVAAPHGLAPEPLDALIECELDRQTIRYVDAEGYQRFLANPAAVPCTGGESFADVYGRVATTLEELFRRHEGRSILVVSHHIVNRTYLAGLLGLTSDLAGQVKLDSCGISVVVRENGATSVSTLNASFHLQGVAA